MFPCLSFSLAFPLFVPPCPSRPLLSNTGPCRSFAYHPVPCCLPLVACCCHSLSNALPGDPLPSAPFCCPLLDLVPPLSPQFSCNASLLLLACACLSHFCPVVRSAGHPLVRPLLSRDPTPSLHYLHNVLKRRAGPRIPFLSLRPNMNHGWCGRTHRLLQRRCVMALSQASMPLTVRNDVPATARRREMNLHPV